MQIYKVISQNGISVLVEAVSQHQALQRAQSPEIVCAFSRMVQQSLSQISNVELMRGPQHQIKELVFDDKFFKNQ